MGLSADGGYDVRATLAPDTSNHVRVLIVDDDALVRSGVRMMLDGTDRVEVVGEAKDGSEVLAAVDAHRPDLALMDLRMRPKRGCLEAL